MELKPGVRLGPYEILSPLGAGGMGEVWRAHDTRLDRDVAIKISHSEFTARFEREARTVAAFNHPHICQLFDIGPNYLVMELIEGTPLQGPLPPEKAVAYACEILDALEAAHRKGIAHRDLKPANILVTARGIKLLDFGLAKTTAVLQPDDKTVAALTTDGQISGTLQYMAPEQLQGKEVDARSDIFSFGCVLYEMLSGARAFPGDSPAEIIAAILTREPAPVQTTAALEGVLRTCLAKDPSGRFHSAHDLALAMRGLANPTPATTPATAAPRRSRMRLALTLAAAFLLLAAAGLYYLHSRTADAIGSLAVLPFSNMSGSPDTDYLSDGITESLLDSLSELPHLKVMSRSAVSRYKGKEPDVPTAGKQLGVRAVLTGRITVHGDNLTVSAELVDVNDNSHLWGEQYNRKLADALAVQNEIAHQIVDKLQLRLNSAQMTHMVTRQTPNPEAYQLYLKGRYYASQFSREGLDKGMDYFRRAIALDPNYGLAYDGISIYYQLVDDTFMAPSEAMPKAEEAARKALALDDSLVEAHVELATVHLFYGFDWAAAEREFGRAFTLSPTYAPAHEYYSWFLMTTGNTEKALQEGRRAVSLDPLSVEIHSILGWNLYFARRYPEAAAEVQRCLELDPDYPPGYFYLGLIYAQQGRLDEAMAAQRKSAQLFGNENAAWPLPELARDYALAGRKTEARQLLQDILSHKQKVYALPSGIAVAYAALGDKDKAFEQLEQAFTQRSFFMDFLKSDPRLDSLRSDPRFASLLSRMNLL